MLKISEVYSSQAIASLRTSDASNAIPYMGEAWFPDRKLAGIDIKWIRSHKGLGVALAASNPDAQPTLRPRGKAEITKEELPMFRQSRLIKEHDLMELSRIQGTEDPFLRPVVDSMYDDANDLLEGADIVAEMMRMQLLSANGGSMGISIGTSDNMIYKYDYDKDGSWKKNHYVELKGDSTWDNPKAKPLDDIRRGVQYLANTGTTAAFILGTSGTFDYLLDNEQVRNALITASGTSVAFMDSEAVGDVLQRRLRLAKKAYDKTYVGYDDAEKKFYPDDYVTIIGNRQLGNTWRGTTPEEMTVSGSLNIPNAPVDITVLPSGVAVAVQTKYEPAFKIITTVSQIVLPSFEGMDSIYVIKVK